MSPAAELLAKVLLAVALVMGCIWGWNHYTASLVAKGDAAGYARAQNEYAQRELKAVKEARAEEQRKTRAAEEEASHVRTELAALRGNYDDAVVAGRRLRELLAAQRQRPAASNPAAPSGSAPTDPTERVHAELYRSTHQAEERVAQYADEARIAGQACVRIYEAMRAKP
jgi:hypothetical protein